MQAGEIQLISSEALIDEIDRNSDVERGLENTALLTLASCASSGDPQIVAKPHPRVAKASILPSKDLPAERHGIPILFHTGIVMRTPADRELNVSSTKMMPARLDAVARSFPAWSSLRRTRDGASTSSATGWIARTPTWWRSSLGCARIGCGAAS